MNQLFYGDNLDVLRESITEESIDLIYLDPPFKSDSIYNLLFKSLKGNSSHAQIEAFEDTWHWGVHADIEFAEILQSDFTNVSEMIRAMRSLLGENDMMAYLTMMTNRLLELHRVLKPTGSLYLHCDPTASHYLKIVLDGIFDPENFKSEIVWRRTGSHNKATRWAPIHDIILFYTKSKKYTWNHPKRPYMVGHVKEHFVPDGSGGYRTNYYGNVLTGSGTRKGESGKEWRGFNPTAKGRHWAIPGAIWNDVDIDPSGLKQHEKLDLLYELGLIKIIEDHAWPIYERSITSKDGPASPDLWTFQPYTKGTVHDTTEGIDSDISWLKPRDAERLGFPTQKPLGLLERIIQASSNVDDLVLDPFCGCGTTIHAAQKLKRQWLGIDITHLAIALIENRIHDAFPKIEYEVHGTPKDIEGARDLAQRDKYQFQWWACSLVNAQPWQGKKKGADSGIDGVIYFQENEKHIGKIIVSIKGGENVGVSMIRDLGHVIVRDKADIGLFVTLTTPTKPMLREATKTGFYESIVTKKAFSKIQILTIEGLLSGVEQAVYPDLGRGGLTFKKAKEESVQQDLF